MGNVSEYNSQHPHVFVPHGVKVTGSKAILKVCGLGEELWDAFPDGEKFGGAPANFTCHCNSLGAEAYVVSCIAFYAFEPKKSIFPFIPVAHAQVTACTLTAITTNYDQELYARAYDAEGLWGESVHVTVITPITRLISVCPVSRPL